MRDCWWPRMALSDLVPLSQKGIGMFGFYFASMKSGPDLFYLEITFCDQRIDPKGLSPPLKLSRPAVMYGLFNYSYLYSYLTKAQQQSS